MGNLIAIVIFIGIIVFMVKKLKQTISKGEEELKKMEDKWGEL